MIATTVDLPQPYLLFVGDVTDPGYAKTAFGLRDWAPEKCIGEHACAANAVTLGLPKLTPAEARARGARSMIIGVANIGGRIVDSWMPSLLGALEAGLDLIGGCSRRALSASAHRRTYPAARHSDRHRS